MHFSTITALFAATVLGVPTEPLLNTRSWTGPESGLHVRNMGDQGDGFYLAVFNEPGVADVQFKAASELNTTSPVETLSTRDGDGLAKRAGTTCSGRKSIDLGTLNAANIQLANNANAQGSFGFHAWGWVSSSSLRNPQE
ncbi:hypothetical protein DL769_003326 [Monosporascus sp. CRB-8-3]|nr:hypothetical protein DL769_003326 [Monosporascus sp. CRB-8-3]